MTVNPKEMSPYGIVLELDIEGAVRGRLKNKTFVIKDLYDLEGYVTGGGSPDWRAKQLPAPATAPVVTQLLEAGAWLKGKSCTDELACSLDGINPFFGTPLNTQLPDRIPGGSSSGSASAVAAGIVDFALGTDTIVSVRVPAGYCGIYGFRPTYGIVSTTGVMPLSPSFDTVGWFACSADVLNSVGNVLIEMRYGSKEIANVGILQNTFDLVSVDVLEPLMRHVQAVKRLFSTSNEVNISQHWLEMCASIFNIVRACECWRIYGGWIERDNPQISETVMARLTEGRTISRQEESLARMMHLELSEFIEEIVAEAGVLCLPTTWDLPPEQSASMQVLATNRRRNVLLSALSSIAGLPQVSVPVEVMPDIKMGLSLIGSRGTDLQLLDLAVKLEREHVSLGHVAPY